jgi:hypothetical protein
MGVDAKCGIATSTYTTITGRTVEEYRRIRFIRAALTYLLDVHPLTVIGTLRTRGTVRSDDLDRTIATDTKLIA